MVSERWIEEDPFSPLPSAGALTLIRIEWKTAIVAFRGDEWEVPVDFLEEC